MMKGVQRVLSVSHDFMYMKEELYIICALLEMQEGGVRVDTMNLINYIFIIYVCSYIYIYDIYKMMSDITFSFWMRL